ncbi:Endonuclease/exonuclease/phosphatase [Cinara cedri]|uniref:Endonuclease/exonuclease/phosphatase n=1 Tax=Cinara cedri TaxID=506608 RepID=A0A5E4N839_9HEMI|nr:Endonuclease/exonuclease/phosphatase [Cinara cedri]
MKRHHHYVQSVQRRLITSCGGHRMDPAMTSHHAHKLTELRIDQHNLNGQHIVVKQLRDYCIHNKVDLALIQEFPSKNRIIKGLDHDPIRCIVGSTGQKPGAAIIVFNVELEVTVLSNLSSVYFTVITVRIGREIINFVSSYFKFNILTVEFVMRLDVILNEMKGETVICADVNAHSPLWMCDASNNTARVKGRKIEDLIEKHQLTVHNNNRRTHRCNRVGMGTSNIDVTMTTARVAGRISRWKVIKGITKTLLDDINFLLKILSEKLLYTFSIFFLIIFFLYGSMLSEFSTGLHFLKMIV